MTILECWKLKLPVLIYKPKDYYIDFSTFLKRKDLLWENIYELNFKINHVINNFEKFTKEYYSHYQFLQIDSKKSLQQNHTKGLASGPNGPPPLFSFLLNFDEIVSEFYEHVDPPIRSASAKMSLPQRREQFYQHSEEILSELVEDETE